VVVEVIKKDEDRNQSRAYTEYTVRDLHAPEFYYSCRRLHPTGGLTDGDDFTLRAASTTFSQLPFTLWRSAKDIDGDRVLLAFTSGSHARAIILGVLNAELQTYCATKEQGRRRYTQHRDSSIEICDDGTMQIIRHIDGIGNEAQSILTLAANGDVTVEHNSGAKIHVLTDGTVQLESGVATNGIKFGFAAAQQLVRGNLFRATYNAFVALFNALVAAYNEHTHASPAGQTSIPLAPGSSPVPNPYFASPPGNPYLGILYVVDQATITASKTTPFPLPDQPTAAGVSEADDMPESDLSEKVITE
jgi:hypothetical protein